MTTILPSTRRRAFTLVELMVSLAVIALLVLLLASIVNQTSSIWRRTTGKAEQFREVRAGFDAMTTRLAQATLNTYWDYDNRINPTKYQRRSELRFMSGPARSILGSAPSGGDRPTHCVFFQAPLGFTEAMNANGSEKYAGFENLLCGWGYYLQYGDDRELRPAFLPESQFPLRHRFRLMEFWQPAEKNNIYGFTSGLAGTIPRSTSYRDKTWFTNAINTAKPPVRVLAENVVALVITPRLAQGDELEIKGGSGDADHSPLAPNYLYDSSPVTGAPDSRYSDGRLNPVNQLPPVLQVTMVAIDEISAQRLNFDATTDDPFGTRAKFSRSADYSRDLLVTGAADSLENNLIELGANYRVFTTNVVIRGAKWSREQSN